MSRPWMPLYIGDYLKDTRHLTAAQHGGYLLLIMSYWEKGFLPDDEDQLMRLAAMTEKEWKANRKAIGSFFVAGWRHERVERELAGSEEKYQRRANAGRSGGAATSAKRGKSNAPSNAEQKRSNATGNATGNAPAMLPALGYQPQPHSLTREEPSQEGNLDRVEGEAGTGVIPLAARRS